MYTFQTQFFHNAFNAKKKTINYCSPFRFMHDVAAKAKKGCSSLSEDSRQHTLYYSRVHIERWWTHWSCQRGTVHMDSPSPCPANSSRTPWQHQLRSRWSIPSSPRHLRGNGRPGNSSPSECLRRCTRVRRMSGAQVDKTNNMRWGLTDAAHPCGVELKVQRALA